MLGRNQAAWALAVSVKCLVNDCYSWEHHIKSNGIPKRSVQYLHQGMLWTFWGGVDFSC